MLPTNLGVVGATEDLLLEVTATELGAELEPGTELGVLLEATIEEVVPPLHAAPFTVGRSAVEPFLLP